MPSTAPVLLPPPDQRERQRALDASRCALVRAPAGSGKTDLLTRRFLRLLAEVDEPDQIVAITFTKAAAAEMRHRILATLENAAASEDAKPADDEFSMEALAQRALTRSRERGWNLLELPAQLRISTIDSFCRELAIQQPLLSGLGGGLEIDEQPRELYRRAARRTLEAIGGGDPALREAIEALLLWRDNGWQEIEDQLVEMLESRDRWMHDFVVGRNADWDSLRERLERPFRNCVGEALASLNRLLDQVPGAREEALELARFACVQTKGALHQELAELADFPAASFNDAETLEAARQACACLATLLTTKDGGFRQRIDKTLGFPADRKQEKSRLLNLIADLDAVPGLESALCAIKELPPARYTEEDWRIVRACFLLLLRAAAELKVVFAETGTADYIEVAQIAEEMLKGENEIPSEAALAIADTVRHLLVDEFQDTSRRQHRLLGRLIAAWAEREGRTCFVVGDPMQSIYFFRDADAELFPRVENGGLEIPHDLPLQFDPVRLFANFRTARPLVTQCNEIFSKVFAESDGSGISFSRAEPARNEHRTSELQIVDGERARMQLHLEFTPETVPGKPGDSQAATNKKKITEERKAASEKQIAEIVNVIRTHLPRIEQARADGAQYRVAVLGRTRTALAPVAEALRAASIPFRAIELEKLRERPEIRDALALARALLGPEDRVAWLGVLRAPWCGLSLDNLHELVSADDPELLQTPVPKLLAERQELLSAEGRRDVARVLDSLGAAHRLRFAQPTASVGTWIGQVWLRLGGAQCVDAVGRANVNLVWRALDDLPNGEQDLLGPALDAALEKLTALPDPAADPGCGVQLMTIHKSKGLEFEIVIVPDLQASAARGKGKLLSWLERGLAEAEQTDEPTEFLVAPLQSKGSERGTAKAWVDCVYRARELQEMRRLLYVAATRAREELHLFARPAYKRETDGSFSLVKPRESLLATAWPAVEAEVRARFDAWRMRAAEPVMIESIAASGEETPPALAARERGTLLRRLPTDYEPEQAAGLASAAEAVMAGAGRLYERHEGGVLSRALGNAVHALFDQLARLRLSADWAEARPALARMESRMTAQIRAGGIERPQAGRIAKDALEIALKASRDPIGQWILSPHADAGSEVRWAGVVAGSLQTVQVDRVFRAGAEPLNEDGDVWWVIDYKTAHEEGLRPEDALPKLRKNFAPQVESYAKVLRNLHGAATTVRCGLYYPRMLKFDWWEI
jgi:ATP-dependent exoDNAse (exonuclease V) beta subunit